MVAVFSPSSIFQAIDGIAFLTELGELTCASGLELLDAHFQSTRRHGKFGAQLVLVRLNLGHRQWRGGLEPAHRQTYGARMNKRNDNESDQSRDKKSDAEKHDRLNHETYASNSSARGENQRICAGQPQRRRRLS